jgi:hypothetical protein
VPPSRRLATFPSRREARARLSAPIPPTARIVGPVATFLTLTPAFGGARYGPFTGEHVSLGSDARCQVLVNAALGALPLHAWLTPRPGGWTLQPGTPDAVLFVARKGGRTSPVTGPVDLVAGDAITLDHRDGVTFVVSDDSPAGKAVSASAGRGASPKRAPTSTPIRGPQPAARRPSSGPNRTMPTAGDFAQEARRMAEVELMRIGPVQRARQMLFRYESGSLFQPRYILGALFALASGGFVTCTGVAGWLWMRL